MTDVSTTLPPALGQGAGPPGDPPAEPDVSKGYLDLLGAPGAADDDVAKNTGAIQAVWASPIGSFLYDNAQALTRRFIAAWQLPIDWLNIPPGGIALDVGSGPGSITASLARAAGPDGLALGVDISEPMLARAVRAAAGPQVGFLRADAQRLPLRDQTVDAAVSIAVLQLIPDPAATLSEIARVLRPGGRLAVMVPTLRSAVRPLAEAAHRRGSRVRRRRNRRHPGRARLRQRADQERRDVPVGARQTRLTVRLRSTGWFVAHAAVHAPPHDQRHDDPFAPTTTASGTRWPVGRKTSKPLGCIPSSEPHRRPGAR